MSQTYFSKQDPAETVSRLSLLGQSKGIVTLWQKGTKEKYNYKVSSFEKDRLEIVLDTKEQNFRIGQTVLCAFELRGMNFFSEVILQVSINGHSILQFKNVLFKSERRDSYRLLTFPHHQIWAEFDLSETFEDGKVVDIRTKNLPQNVFKSFLKLVGDKTSEDDNRVGIRVQDLSTTGMSLHVSEIEAQYFRKDLVFHKVTLRFTDEVVLIPELKVVYMVDFLSQDKSVKKYKLGIHFENLPTKLDDHLGKKINILLRENDSNKDFENFIK